MAGFDSETIAEIKSRLSMLDIINRYVELRQTGERWTAPCPFHQETKPSFTVSPDKGFYYCFGCQASGDLIDFYKEINGLNFSEALRQLAHEAGVEIRKSTSVPDKKEKDRVSISQEVNSLAGRYFVDCLWSDQGKRARQYLVSRKISREMTRDFRLGWSPGGWQNLAGFLDKNGFTADEGVLAGVLSRNQKGQTYDRFRSRLIFPIISLSGMVVAFGGRTLDEGEPKYLNSSESPVYTKGDHLYGLFQARKHITRTKRVYLTEGYLDVIALHQYGFPNSCGVLGTALTGSQVRRLGGLSREVVLLFDGDEAGRNAAFRSAEMLIGAGIGCRVLNFPQGEDAHSLLTTRDQDVFEDLLGSAVAGLDYCLRIAGSHKSPKELLSWVNNFINSLSDFSLKTYYIPKVAGALGLTEMELRKNLEKPKAQPRADISGRGSPATPGPDQRDREILTFASCFPEYRKNLEQKGIDLILSSEWAVQFWKKIKEKTGDDHHGLDEQETDFYYRARLQRDSLKKNREQVLRDLEAFVSQVILNMSRQNLKQALIRAQKNNDHQEVKRILGLMQSYL